ncbi:Glutamate--cysteine ligase EgtA [Streptomyces sp. RB5]|uniref:Glutamate--cysteine ligase EgtA n=1 Tax=Streptomyces smaragdinus TaxID=2585196 RepID=A0A7K0CAC6_9ACTN|nr:ergothioneine biosynthesis glutamate--cysteine ligase EgtA [Streptomyces smaragdinus]MQY10411.1 Glutamate--cysteine ligase EgtA [Streptomyces smaragdinus]
MEAQLGKQDAETRIGGICFKTGPPGRTGAELEWLVHDRAHPRRPLTERRLTEALAPLTEPGALPGGSSLTREPGGQVELSSRPADSVAGCVEDLAADQAALDEVLARSGLLATGRGLDPFRVQRRILDEPRYRAMERHFDRIGPWGRVMMRSTAAVQINLEAGDDPAAFRHRWILAHRLGPVLLAAFANSPLWRGRPTGWRSTRQAVWARADPDRTRPAAADGGDPHTDWARYALDAPVMCIRRPPPEEWTAPDGLTFRTWLAEPADGRGAEPDDLDYHLSTLFPPVRPRGWLELRMIDAQPGPGWAAAVAVAATLLDDPCAAEAAYEATEPLTGGGELPPPELWLHAARHGPADTALGKAVRACVSAAEAALTGEPRRAVAQFAERYAERGRCPADDLLEGTTR